MMREILFRGKTKPLIKESNGIWVEGSLIQAENYCCILDERNIEDMDYPYLDGDLGTIDGCATPINPETVGQYTGLTDKNGTKIFEGDIVKTQKRHDRPYSKNKKSKRHIGVVKYQVHSGDKFYNVDTGKWDRHLDYGAEWIVKVEDYGKFVHGSWGDFWDCEVIGNIHDNPELLEVAK